MAVQKLGQSTMGTTQEKFQLQFIPSKKQQPGHGKWRGGGVWGLSNSDSDLPMNECMHRASVMKISFPTHKLDKEFKKYL